MNVERYDITSVTRRLYVAPGRKGNVDNLRMLIKL
jgi:hypothetical protein